MESSLTFSRAHFGPPSWEQSHSTNFEHWVLLFYFRAVFQAGSRDEVGSVSLPECPVISQFVGNKAKGWISKRVFLENKARQIFRKTNISYPLIRTRTNFCQGPFNLYFYFSSSNEKELAPILLRFKRPGTNELQGINILFIPSKQCAFFICYLAAPQ